MSFGDKLFTLVFGSPKPPRPWLSGTVISISRNASKARVAAEDGFVHHVHMKALEEPKHFSEGETVKFLAELALSDGEKTEGKVVAVDRDNKTVTVLPEDKRERLISMAKRPDKLRGYYYGVLDEPLHFTINNSSAHLTEKMRNNLPNTEDYFSSSAMLAGASFDQYYTAEILGISEYMIYEDE